jgi:hypothetical protein
MIGFILFFFKMVGGLKKKAFHHPIDSIVIKLLIGTTSFPNYQKIAIFARQQKDKNCPKFLSKIKKLSFFFIKDIFIDIDNFL